MFHLWLFIISFIAIHISAFCQFYIRGVVLSFIAFLTGLPLLLHCSCIDSSDLFLSGLCLRVFRLFIVIAGAYVCI